MPAEPIPFVAGDAEDPDELDWAELQHALRTQLTVALGRARLMRRRLGNGPDLAPMATDPDALERALAQLRTTVGQLERFS